MIEAVYTSFFTPFVLGVTNVQNFVVPNQDHLKKSLKYLYP